MADQVLKLAESTAKRALVEVLSAEQTRQTGFTHRFRIPFNAINNPAWTAQGDTVTVTLGDTPTRWVLSKAVAIITKAFVNPGTLSLQVGTDGDQDNFIDAQNAKVLGVLIGAAGAVPVTEAGSFGHASDVLVARFTTQASTGAPSTTTDGEAEILLAITDLDQAL